MRSTFLSAALRAGHPIASALELLTVEMPDPIGSQFGSWWTRSPMVPNTRHAQAMAERWGLDDMRMFVVVASVQSETAETWPNPGKSLTRDPRAPIDDAQGTGTIE